MIGDEDLQNSEFYNIELTIQAVVVVFNINVWIYLQVVFAVHISDASKVPVWGNDTGSYVNCQIFDPNLLQQQTSF